MASTISNIAASIAANASAELKEEFRTLWKDHLALLKEGKFIYFLPQAMGTPMGTELTVVAARLSEFLQTDVYVHFDTQQMCYRIGPILGGSDQLSMQRFTYVWKSDWPPIAASIDAPISQLHSHHTDDYQPPDSMACNSHLPLSEQKVEKIPKPRNSWIIYRQAKHSVVLAANPGMHTSNISTIIADMWRTESAEVKAHYKQLADQEKYNHQLHHPGYKCSPRKSSEIHKRKKSSKKTMIIIEGSLPVTYMGRISDKTTSGIPNVCGGYQPQAASANNPDSHY